jgi:glycosyltransferase involved in cell wall biosynthesis
MNTEINNKLSIVIPTYNRASFLDYSLETHIPLAKEHNIPIYVSDNASPDNTNEIVKKWMERYEFLYYYRNQNNLGADLNIELVLNKPNTDYIWLLGDTSKINKEVLVGVLGQSKKHYDLILLNDQGRVTDVETQLITNKEYLLSYVGWNMSQMSSLIYSKKVIKNANYTRFYGTNFIQTGIALEYLACQESISVKWNKELSVGSLKKDGLIKTSWRNNTFDIWIRKWMNFVLSLPSVYSFESKIKMIQTHSQRTKIFSFRNLLLLRSEGFYNMRHYINYNKFFDISLGSTNTFKFLCIAILPVKFAKILINIYRKYK